MQQEQFEYLVTLYRGRRAMVSFATQSLDEVDQRTQEWNGCGEGHTSMTERREIVLSEGNEMIPLEGYLTQVAAN